MNLQNCQIYDISPRITPHLAVFPGDTPFRARVLLDLRNGDNLTLSSMESTMHLGAHADAPCHYARDGVSIAERELSLYLGPAQVIEVPRVSSGRIRPHDLQGVTVRAPRVLFKTGSFPDPDTWTDDFMALSPELVDDLAARGVLLVGIDTPSVDLAQDKELLSHHRIQKHDLAILEGLVLDQVRPGLYELIALPLRIQGAEASPVRAILLEASKNGTSS